MFSPSTGNDKTLYYTSAVAGIYSTSIFYSGDLNFDAKDDQVDDEMRGMRGK